MVLGGLAGSDGLPRVLLVAAGFLGLVVFVHGSGTFRRQSTFCSRIPRGAPGQRLLGKPLTPAVASAAP
jgi:hypothetical protein